MNPIWQAVAKRVLEKDAELVQSLIEAYMANVIGVTELVHRLDQLKRRALRITLSERKQGADFEMDCFLKCDTREPQQ